MAKKRKGTRIIKALLIAFLLAFLVLIFHYLYFEISRIEGYNVKLFEDWRSYTAYVFSKIPFLKERVEYKPMKIGNASEYYKVIFSGISKDLSDKLKEIERRERDVEKLREEYQNMIKILKDLQKRWKEEMEGLEKQKEVYLESKKRIEDLANLFKSSDPAQIARTISQEAVSVETVAAVLKLLPDDVSAEIVQELSKINPEKSALVLNTIGGVDEILRKMEDTRRDLEKTLEKTSSEIEKLINIGALRDSLSEYMDSLSSDEIVKIMVNMNFDVDTVSAILSMLPKPKFTDVMEILQKEHPELFKKVVERGVGS